MQDYTYSIFSSVAIVIHLIINFNLLFRKRQGSVPTLLTRYRGFLVSILAYYIVDAAWGIFAGLHWIGIWYLDTILFFSSLAVFALMWGRFVIAYLDFEKTPARIISWFGNALLAFNIALLAVNIFNNCVFRFDENGKYVLGSLRHLPFYLLIAFIVLTSILVLAKALGRKDSVRRRGMMVFLLCVTMAVAIALQVILPLTPFTALGCLIGNCFFNAFVVADEQTAKHMNELEKALARARAAEKSRSLFFSIVSHDIRTPLNAIIGYSEILQFGDMTESERNEALKSIRTSSTTLLQLVNDVLDLAKMDAGKMKLQPEPMRLFQLTDDVLSSFRMIAAQKGIELVNRTAEVPTVLLDGHRFRQILFNLIGNAIKFTERGSVKIAASYAEGDLRVSVSDTGCGIAPDMLTRILEPFVQVQDPKHAADRAGGTGLGLSISRSLVEVMGGELIVESEVGKGSTFTAHIPGVAANDEKAAQDAAPKQTKTIKDLPKHVLVVDDSSVNRAVLTALLRKAGVTSIKHACDGGEALAELNLAMDEGKPFDFIFSDFWMPNMNGLELIEKIRADSRFNQIHVYAVTADTEFNHDPRHNLFNGVLLKPLTYDKLVAVFSITGR